MTEWVLLIVLASGAGDAPALSSTVISGFSTAQKCEAALGEVGNRLQKLAGIAAVPASAYKSSGVGIFAKAPEVKQFDQSFACVALKK